MRRGRLDEAKRGFSQLFCEREGNDDDDDDDDNNNNNLTYTCK